MTGQDSDASDYIINDPNRRVHWQRVAAAQSSYGQRTCGRLRWGGWLSRRLPILGLQQGSLNDPRSLSWSWRRGCHCTTRRPHDRHHRQPRHRRLEHILNRLKAEFATARYHYHQATNDQITDLHEHEITYAELEPAASTRTVYWHWCRDNTARRAKIRSERQLGWGPGSEVL
jgi:hypothetical protein